MSPTAGPSRLPERPQERVASALKPTSPERSKLLSEPRRGLASPTLYEAALLGRAPHRHPLSQSPITAGNPLPSPLPLVSLVSPQVGALRSSLHRRRSSFPPAAGSTITGANSYPWVMGGTPGARPTGLGQQQESWQGFGNELVGEAPVAAPASGAWESLLNFDGDDARALKGEDIVADPPSSPTQQMARVRSSTGMARSPSQLARLGTPKTNISHLPSTTDRYLPGNEAFKALLTKTVDVEGVGSVGVARILLEVWKRGGGDVVTAQYLWPSILMSLSLSPEHGISPRVATPSPHAALALQALYNIAIRPSESFIFAGFLSSYMASAPTPAASGFQDSQVYGALTPTKSVGEPDLSQWTTFTPGEEWPSLATTLPSGSGLTPRRPFSPALGLPPIEFSAASEFSPRPSLSGPADGVESGEGINGIDEIIAQLEDASEQREAEAELHESQSQEDWKQADSVKEEETDIAMQLPTPETDGVLDYPREQAIQTNPSTKRKTGADTPETASQTLEHVGSPFVSGASVLSATSASSAIPTVPLPNGDGDDNKRPVVLKVTRNRPTQLSLPTAEFVPPPPMCLFFSPAFRDLQKGKVGVWKGELAIRGRGGGNFNVLIIGEEGSDALWQSHTWTETLTYPPDQVVTQSAYTASMIPVSTLAREGLLPVTMGMVLCNDDNNLEAFVNMVQGLHAEGAFHLPLPGSRLPIVFLPAKFDTSDPLQRLGIAFMTKGGVSPLAQTGVHEPEPSANGEPTQDEETSPERKRRRKSSSSLPKPRPAAPEKKPTVRRRSAPVRPNKLAPASS
ncbi:hypothetical protein Q8F55_002380 [Vanrija albida]|uniref:ARID domain-containing protein n=1 Tax=Vanrija albida TaxID=181172 RepID=A0ABR3Q9M6_9TREE